MIGLLAEVGPTWWAVHAEAMALQVAGRKQRVPWPIARQNHALTLENAPCCDALIKAGISKVVVAAQDPT